MQGRCHVVTEGCCKYPFSIGVETFTFALLPDFVLVLQLPTDKQNPYLL